MRALVLANILDTLVAEIERAEMDEATRSKLSFLAKRALVDAEALHDELQPRAPLSEPIGPTGAHNVVKLRSV
ncbi:hypothetical protein [Methylobacterium durans]|uniref:Uncharacterized protein n=1 Tax=Methylobacterium durans TaxID=2202825 RepID=A0A2U8W2E7_9HYPH|nr:hypothetical protein [Methylobacterium durans]AWN40274.1 hypothetical protein DK389_06640 [Methylobacterium durans]